MLKYLLQGILLGLAYVAPIGTQNLYVINTALRKDRLSAFRVAIITVLFDISLALSCFFGIGFLIDKSTVLKGTILLLGSVVVIYIGFGLICSTSNINDDVKIDDSLVKVTSTCFVVTWFNPQAIVDGSLLLGGINASLPDEMAKYFILGVCIASFVWFTSLAFMVSIFKSKFNKNVLRSINIVCGAIIIFYGAKLGYSFIRLII